MKAKKESRWVRAGRLGGKAGTGKAKERAWTSESMRQKVLLRWKGRP
jgi:hypothetical protein